jgi:ABC-type Zn uptake system ZnuABC Zn-binding protein ZnuA
MFDEWKQMAAANQAAANQENINAIKALMAEKGIKELPTDQQTEAADTPKKAIALIDSYTNKIYGSTSTSSESYTDTLKNKTPTKIKISSNLQSITISQPKRDNAGLSAIDRVIQANKGWSDSEALANLT